MVDIHDIINVKSWMNLGDCNYEIDHADDSIPESGVVYCNIEHIHKLFEKCKRTDNQYVVVSAFSDYGFARQKERPVSDDMKKMLALIAFNEQILDHYISDSGQDYKALQIEARCDHEQCRKQHEFSIKCYAYTYSTVPNIPSNVKKWFLANSMVHDDRIQGIPLGVGKDGGEDIFNVSKMGIPKQNYLYINWQDNTVERAHIKNYFLSHNPSWCTIRLDPLPFTDYLKDMASHAFVLCPQGNGIDCYRMLEAIYLGCVPVVERSPTMEYLKDLPIMMVDSFFDINMSMLKEFSQKTQGVTPNIDKSKLSYWKEKIGQARELCLS